MTSENSFKLPKEILAFLRELPKAELEELSELKNDDSFLIQIMPRIYEGASLPGKILMDMLMAVEKLEPEKTYRTNLSHHFARAIASHLNTMNFSWAVKDFFKLVEHALETAAEAEEGDEKAELMGVLIRNFFRLLSCAKLNKASRVPFHTQVIGERGASVQYYLSASAEEAFEEVLLMSETFWLEPASAESLDLLLQKLQEAFHELFRREDLAQLKPVMALKKAVASLTVTLDELTVDELWFRETAR